MHWKTSSENLLQDIRDKEGPFIGKLFRQEKEGRFPHGSRPSFSDLLLSVFTSRILSYLFSNYAEEAPLDAHGATNSTLILSGSSKNTA